MSVGKREAKRFFEEVINNEELMEIHGMVEHYIDREEKITFKKMYTIQNEDCNGELKDLMYIYNGIGFYIVRLESGDLAIHESEALQENIQDMDWSDFGIAE